MTLSNLNVTDAVIKMQASRWRSLEAMLESLGPGGAVVITRVGDELQIAVASPEGKLGKRQDG